jgi:hypothetical protein
VAMLAFTRVGPESAYWLLSIALLLFGVGLGATTTPAMSAAYQTLEHTDIARATAVLNIAMRVGGSIGVALLAVVLQRELDGARDAAAKADAFGHAFTWAVALIVVAITAALLLPRRQRP